MSAPTIKEIRKAVADDLYDTLTNNRNFRSRAANDIVSRMSDDEARQAYSDAGLDEDDDWLAENE